MYNRDTIKHYTTVGSNNIALVYRHYWCLHTNQNVNA